MPMYNLIEYNPDYSETTGSLWFYSIDEATNFNSIIANTDNVKIFMYKTKLLESTEADGDKGILRNVGTAVPLKYSSNFWRSREISLINCKAKLKLKWKMNSVLSAAGNNNDNNRDDNIIFHIEDTKLYVPVETLSVLETTKNYQNVWENDLKDQFIGMNIKQKERIKIQQMNIGIF